MNGTAGASSSSGPSSAPNTGITVSTTDSSTASGSGSATQRRGHVRKESSGHICTACDQCYRCKVRCSGERPTCERCQRNNSACTYSTGKPLGKPKGSKNKVKRLKTPQESEQQTAIAPADSNHHFDPRHLSTSPRKRSSDGALPLAKRMATDHSGPTSIHTGPLSRHPGPTSSDMGLHLNTTYHAPPPPRDSSELLPAEPLLPPYYPPPNQHAGPPSPSPAPSNDARKLDYPPSADLGLDIDDFGWFTQSESYLTGTPTAIAAPPMLDDTLHGPLAPDDAVSPRLFTGSNMLVLAQAPPHASPPTTLAAPPQHQHQQQPSCLCDPLSLHIIAELHSLRGAGSPLDSALLVARRGLLTVSSYLACPACLSGVASSPSLFLACVLIVQQVFSCYMTLRGRGAALAGSAGSVTSSAPSSPTEPGEGRRVGVAIGEFEVEGEESCGGVLEAVVRAEMERGKGVVGGLERWAEKLIGAAGRDGKERAAGLLLRSLREEIGGGGGW